MKKKMGFLWIAVFCAILITGCATSPYRGFIYSGVESPAIRMQAPLDAQSSSKEGEGTCTNILGLIAFGDASLTTIMKNANITKIHHVDVNYTNFLTIFCQETIKVYGE